jgi:translation initiation factor 2B subunit (eIF-2B alpha/beta/delta family)
MTLTGLLVVTYCCCYHCRIPSAAPQVILSPNAVTADGGAICPSGMLMVCIAAKVRNLCAVSQCDSSSLLRTPWNVHAECSD